MSRYEEAARILEERFGRDSLISIATVEGGRPHVRTVDACYEDGAFYAVTYTLSNKMKQIAANPEVAVCGEWFTGHGMGENLGHVRDGGNAAVMAKLRQAFAAWYGNGHVNEDDPNTCLLRVRLTDGILMNEGARYEIDFVTREA
ncbi:pyridoxamine 5'-phosphate oxidase family protein [Eubacteriales bacterium OttesenSCG-928-A19]|nr:pyridoxamine 5'-phosphate oxidase family protein [Eubacteriales bacterium OttesenSCG-928-A19]